MIGFFGVDKDWVSGRSIVDVSDYFDYVKARDPAQLTPLTIEKIGKRRRLEKVSKEISHSWKSGSFIGGGSITEAYIRTLAIDCLLTSQRMRVEDYEAFRKPFLSGIGDPVLNPYWNQGSLGAKKIIPVHDLISNMICRRSLIISKRGYLGLAPA